jgi:hypothetical protein
MPLYFTETIEKMARLRQPISGPSPGPDGPGVQTPNIPSIERSVLSFTVPHSPSL